MSTPHPNPGFAVALLTFPGVIVHEFAHKLFCQWTGTRVIQVCYFRYGNPVGYVLHDIPNNIWKHILIDVGPFFVNTSISFVMGLFITSLNPYKTTSEFENLFIAIGTWLSFSIAMHSFPSIGDAESIWSAIWQRGTPISARILGVPLVTLIFLGAVGSIFWLNAFYAGIVVILIPYKLIMN